MRWFPCFCLWFSFIHSGGLWTETKLSAEAWKSRWPSLFSFCALSECTRFVRVPRSHCAISSHPLPPVTASGFMCMWLPRRPSYCTLPAEPVTRPDVFPSAPSSWPSFMMETDTNTVIGFRDKLFTLPMLSAAVSLLRGRPSYKWPLFLDLILLIDPWQRQYMCDWGSCGESSSAARNALAGVCVCVCVCVVGALAACAAGH